MQMLAITIKKNLQKNFSYFLVLLAFGLFTSCNKDDPNTPNDSISEEEVVAIVEGALMTDTEGITAEAEDAAFLADEMTQQEQFCGLQSDSTIVRNYTGDLISAYYTSIWTWTLNCNDLNLPSDLDFSRSTSGVYETQRLASDDEATGNWNLGNLLLGNTYILNGVYNRNGTQQSKIRDQNTFQSSLTLTVTDLQIDKLSLEIVSGTATFVLTGSGSGGSSFSQEGSLEFLGNGMATLVINGNSYEISIG